MSTTVDIDAQVSLLLERLDNTETDAQLLAGLCAQAPLVREVAAACRHTAAFTRSAAQFAAFQVELEADHAADERLLEGLAAAPQGTEQYRVTPRAGGLTDIVLERKG